MVRLSVDQALVEVRLREREYQALQREHAQALSNQFAIQHRQADLSRQSDAAQVRVRAALNELNRAVLDTV